MSLSARNQLKGKVVGLKKGVITAEVVVEIAGGNKVTSIVSLDSVEELGIKEGAEVTAIVKSTDVMILA
ncbi:TOBE domain-containing protein [Clostridium pasteurianum]|uniref:Molybdenum-pterin binding domain protein n=1 Tax=Clostridium pasteurianum BC1 TaxID=86416 RepID=R4KIE0_CLOPA|nr:TOBE domain-containing protein [Clostridium pasteurianum]AGK99385.1 molybdenum-pterin binding domain protein [Clostridium pasteurianum BC1]